MTGRQLALDLGHRPAFGREDFWVGAANHEAVEWIDRYPAWPGYGLALVGPAGSGKTHLAHVFAGHTNAYVTTTADLSRADIGALVAAHGAFVLEHEGGSVDPRAVFHFLNAVKERGGHVLLTTREAPARWGVALADLQSRLSALPVAKIEAPDDALLEAVLVKLFADRQLTVTPDVVAYVLRHGDRSFAAMRSLVERADRESLAGQRAVTVPLVKALLGDSGQ
jgi:chromosomal replication initiation ATPase DnaA